MRARSAKKMSSYVEKGQRVCGKSAKRKILTFTAAEWEVERMCPNTKKRKETTKLVRSGNVHSQAGVAKKIFKAAEI